MINSRHTLFKGISYSYLYIFVYLITGILTTPMLLNHFKADSFALLMLIYTIITYLNNIRFGLPESMAVTLAKSKDKLSNIFVVKKFFLVLIFIVFFTIIVLFILEFFIQDWRIFLGDVYTLNKEEVLTVLYVLIIFSLIKIPFDLSFSAFIGFHEVYLEKIYRILNPLVNFILVVFVVYFNKSIVFFAIWAGLLDLIVSIASFLHMVSRYNILKVNTKNKDIKSIDLFKGGISFFQLSLTQTIIWGMGILLVSHILSLSEVTIYSLSIKVYVYIFYAYVIVNTVIAPLYGKYFIDNRWKDIERVFNLLLLIFPFLGGFIWFGTLYFMSDIVFLWTGSDDFFIGHTFVFFMGMFFYFSGYVNSYITLLYSIGEVKSIIFMRWKEVILNIGISLFFTYYFGLVGISLGMAISIVLVSVFFLPQNFEHKIKSKITLDFNIQKRHFMFVVVPILFCTILIISVTNLFLLKLVFFIIITFFYIIISWKMILSKDKAYIIALLKYKKAKIAK